MAGKRLNGENLSRLQKRITSEEQHLAKLLKWRNTVKEELPGIELLFALRSAKTSPKAMEEGLPNLMLPVSFLGHHGLFIEMKRQGAKITESQRAFLYKMEEQGFCSVACFGAEAAMDIIRWYYGKTPFPKGAARAFDLYYDQNHLVDKPRRNSQCPAFGKS